MTTGDSQSRTKLLNIACIGAAVIACLLQVPKALDALSAPPSASQTIDEAMEDLMARNQEVHDRYMQRFNGRSVFFTPRLNNPPPPPPSRNIATPDPVTPPSPVVPTVPTLYTGPPIVAFDGDHVWFSDDEHLGIGEEINGVRVVSFDGAPWTVRLSYRGWEGDVELLDRGDSEEYFRTPPENNALPDLRIPPPDER